MSGVVEGTDRPVNDSVKKTNNSPGKDWDSWLPMLPKLIDFPWSLNDVSKVLRLGRAREHFRAISPQTIERVCFLLQRPLLRIVTEAERLSRRLERCTRQELQTSIRLILSPTMAKSCLQVGTKALLLYSTSGEQRYQRSKRTRSGLTFPVGRTFRWLVDMKVSRRIYDAAAIYLAATLEFIAEETVYRAVVRIKEAVDHVTPDMIEDCINSDPDLWCLYQPYVHLLSGRTSFGLIDTLDIYAVKSKKTVAQENKTVSKAKALEPCFTTTCVSTVAELSELVARVQHRFAQLNQCKENRALSQVSWSMRPLETLLYFMMCSHNAEGNVAHKKRTHHSLPPLTEWLRVAGVQADHRGSSVVDDDDVRQAARLLLPFNDCNTRIFGPDSTVCESKSMTSQKAEDVIKTDLALRMLFSGRPDLVPTAFAVLGAHKINIVDARGLTPLMYACAQGDVAVVKILIDSHTLLDTKVPKDAKKHPLLDPDLCSWTALSFAVSKSHLQICQMLLDAGASVDGEAHLDGVETPLQIAVTSGNYDLVSLLCAHGADINVTFPLGVGSLGFSCSFAASAAIGQRKILRKLLAEAPSEQEEEEMMSLGDFLQEGYSSSEKKTLPKPLNKKRCRALQEAMYHSCEHGYLDVAMEIRSFGVPWNLHCWSKALFHAYHVKMTSGMTSQMRCLLKDFHFIPRQEYTAEFCDDGLILLFTIFKECQDPTLAVELACVFSSCFGNNPLPTIEELPSTTPAIKIGASYVNNKEMSDVTFLVEGQPFYGHRIILASASATFKTMLSSLDQRESCVRIPDVKYDVFTLVMRYVYTGKTEKITAKHEKMLELLHAAQFFKLDGLHCHCERLLSSNIDCTNVIKAYKCAKKNEARRLSHYSECFILSNMKDVTEHGALRDMVTSSQGTQLLMDLQVRLSERIKSRVSPRKSLY